MVQSMPEILDLVLQLPDQLVLGVVLHVHHGLVVDGLGGVGVLQGAESLLEVGIRGRDAGDHHSPGVATQRVLKIFRHVGRSSEYFFVEPAAVWSVWTLCKERGPACPPREPG